MSVYRDLYDILAARQDKGYRNIGAEVRLMKLSEEVGEVMQAYTGGPDTVANELCDVVIAAMVALHDWTGQPEALLKAKVQELKIRMEVEGS